MSHATDHSTYQAYLKDEIGEVRDVARRYRNISVILMMINILLLLGVIGGTAYTADDTTFYMKSRPCVR
ncbi:uncharacterized protein LOC144428290 isoform X2 [Styela clava]